MTTEEHIEKAKEVVAYYTVAASGTGAIPVPATSAVIIAENGIMLAHLSSALGHQITIKDVAASMGIAGTLNIAGRQVFIEGAKLLGWGTGSVWALAALSALGATTAGVQTYIIGRLAIEIAKNSGEPIAGEAAKHIIDDAKDTYKTFIKEWKEKELRPPEKILK